MSTLDQLHPETDRIRVLESSLAATTDRLRDAELSLERVRRAYQNALEQLHLLRHRIFVASAERRQDHGDQLAFDAMFEQVRELSKQMDDTAAKAGAEAASTDNESGEAGNQTGEAGKQAKRKRGRRNLAESDLPVERIELTDPAREGIDARITFEESSRLGYRRGGPIRIVIARAVYRSGAGETAPTPALQATAEPVVYSDPAAVADALAQGVRLVTTTMPLELVRRSLLAPSMIAQLLVSKYLLGVPFYRTEQTWALQGFSLDRGTMCRYAENIGATLGAIVLTARDHAMTHAFCLATDATGTRIQPGPLADRGDIRGPCRKGHFFVILADRDHVFFEYQARHTSAAVCEMFKGFTGYIQADGHTVYDALFAGRSPPGVPITIPEKPPPTEVGCWSHCRRGFWEAAVCKHPMGIEGLRRIDAIFEADRALADLPPVRRKERRDVLVRPLVDAFFAWVDTELIVPRARGVESSALGYARNQAVALKRFLEDGRLKLDNNGSERAIRPITTARKAWLFFGSDDHAEAAANLFSLVASCKLHGLDPESYLRDVIRVMAHWPRDRYLELSPLFWRRTRARLDPAELGREYGPLTVPPPCEAEHESAGG